MCSQGLRSPSWRSHHRRSVPRSTEWAQPNAEGKGPRMVIIEYDQPSEVFKEDTTVFDQLTPVLDREGVSWILLGNQAICRPMLLVNVPHCFMGTHLYIGRHPIFLAPTVHGFSGLYLGMANHPERITTRLKWLLLKSAIPRC